LSGGSPRIYAGERARQRSATEFESEITRFSADNITRPDHSPCRYDTSVTEPVPRS